VETRAPVLTLWAAEVAEVLGFEHDEALALGRAVAGLKACSKGVSLGLFQPTPREVQEQRRKMPKEETVTVALWHHRAVPCRQNIPMKECGRSAEKAPSVPKAYRNTWRASSVTPSKMFRKLCWMSGDTIHNF
jgi:hypothetical protein